MTDISHTQGAAEAGHVPVLMEQVLSVLSPRPGRTVLDCTLGRGGHAAAILPLLAPGGRYVGLDVDPTNIEHGRNTLRHEGVQVDCVCTNFASARAVLDELNVARVDGVLADLGFASTQMADASRGLSFTAEGPLDMRLDPSLITTAADLLASLSETELADVIYEYGEERFSRRIARKIVAFRQSQPIKTTGQLADLCAAAYGGHGRGRHRIDPATRTFQALRIAVNDELGVLRRLLEELPRLLASGGRAAIISFHSLEDRMVKQAFLKWHQDGQAERLTKKPLIAGDAEIARNRRSRSAKLRGIEWRELPPDESPIE
ncbi:MAG: 16S rRNA (cytosine(1402)-N(4))-methyltransferase RsmH [Planctomycetes bacterium]|nr:16S rRNA (cytosine(1402)-N(4))-methyltransferase RsmH [Planctomycetota bacterium]